MKRKKALKEGKLFDSKVANIEREKSMKQSAEFFCDKNLIALIEKSYQSLKENNVEKRKEKIEKIALKRKTKRKEAKHLRQIQEHINKEKSLRKTARFMVQNFYVELEKKSENLSRKR